MHFWGGEADSTSQAMDVLERQAANDVTLSKSWSRGKHHAGSAPKDSQFEDETIHELSKRPGFMIIMLPPTAMVLMYRQAAEAGVTTVEHCSWVGDDGWGRHFDETVVKKLASGGVWVSPTINSAGNASGRKHLSR